MRYFLYLCLASCLLLSACALPPDKDEVARNLAATIRLGWTCLDVEQVQILDFVQSGKDWKVDASYRIRLTCNKSSLPPEEQQRFEHYLPMCSSVLVQTGDACTLRESALFSESAHGWMPKDLMAANPDLLPLVAKEAKEAKAGGTAKK